MRDKPYVVILIMKLVRKLLFSNRDSTDPS